MGGLRLFFTLLYNEDSFILNIMRLQSGFDHDSNGLW